MSATRTHRTLEVAGATFEVEIEPDRRVVGAEEVLGWVRRSARMVADYCGGEFPVDTLQVRIFKSRGLGYGKHYRGRRIEVGLGPNDTVEDLERDWVMVHEMLHTAFPDLTDRHRWMQEGLSTYLESILRVRHGVLDEDEVWQRWARSMPHGVPGPSHRGLDNTRTWGTVYWGGTLFWFIADLRIRHLTENQRSVQDVVKAILLRGGNSRQMWRTRRVIRVGDEATGTTVLRDLYQSMALRRADIDLEALFERLGVRVDGRRVTFDEGAALAPVRRELF
ncbi:MAG: hypothetical protein AAGF12_07385 [Myxococcota bacterium]